MVAAPLADPTEDGTPVSAVPLCESNPTYRLDRATVQIIAALCWMDLWPSTAIAAVYGINPSAVRRSRDRWFPTPRTGPEATA